VYIFDMDICKYMGCWWRSG